MWGKVWGWLCRVCAGGGAGALHRGQPCQMHRDPMFNVGETTLYWRAVWVTCGGKLL